MPHRDYPPFFNVTQFAEQTGYSVTHLQRAAANYNRVIRDPNNRSKLPEGWGAVMWGTIWVLYPEEYALQISDLFGVEVKLPVDVEQIP